MTSDDTLLFHTEAPTAAELSDWESQLRDSGYLIIPDALPAATVEHFRRRAESLADTYGYPENSPTRMFERGMDFVELLENEPVISLLEQMLGAQLHIIAEQVHRMRAGTEVLHWHADELYLQRPEEMGPTQVVPGSHRACRQPRPEDGDPPEWQGEASVSLTCAAGDCVIYSNHCWHRGAPNTTDRTWLATVAGYSRRFVAQRFWPFLNYHLSRDILDQCPPRQRQLLGEHPRGPYG